MYFKTYFGAIISQFPLGELLECPGILWSWGSGLQCSEPLWFIILQTHSQRGVEPADSKACWSDQEGFKNGRREKCPTKAHGQCAWKDIWSVCTEKGRRCLGHFQKKSLGSGVGKTLKISEVYVPIWTVLCISLNWKWSKMMETSGESHQAVLSLRLSDVEMNTRPNWEFYPELGDLYLLLFSNFFIVENLTQAQKERD